MPPNFRQPKRRGEWAEILFMLRAAEIGLVVSKPYGDSAAFDFIVGHRVTYRVQVRSTSIWRSRSYIASLLHGFPQRPYGHNDFDFIAIYVIPQNAWYIIPGKLVRLDRVICLFPHIPHSRGRFEKYREAWRLLGRKMSPRTRKLLSAASRKL